MMVAIDTMTTHAPEHVFPQKENTVLSILMAGSRLYLTLCSVIYSKSLCLTQWKVPIVSGTTANPSGSEYFHFNAPLVLVLVPAHRPENNNKNECISND